MQFQSNMVPLLGCLTTLHECGLTKNPGPPLPPKKKKKKRVQLQVEIIFQMSVFKQQSAFKRRQRKIIFLETIQQQQQKIDSH